MTPHTHTDISGSLGQLATQLQAEQLEETQFMRAIETEPDCQDLREVYADWLEEFGRTEDAEEQRKWLETERKEENAERVREYLSGIVQWSEDYSEHDDYGAQYDHCAYEDMQGQWADILRRFRDSVIPEKLESHLYSALESSGTIEAEHGANEYASNPFYFPVSSFAVGECEEQVEVYPYTDSEAEPCVLSELQDSGELIEALQANDKEFCLHVGNWVNLSPENDNPRYGYNWELSGEHPTFYLYTNPGGIWHFGFTEESFRSAYTESVIAYCRQTDGK